MNQEQSIGKNIATIVVFALAAGLIAFGLSLWLTPQYKSSSKILVIFNDAGIDAYTASKNSDYITSILSEVVYSNSFINNVYQNNYGLRDDLGFSQSQRLKNWKKEVKVKTQNSKGIIIVETYNSSRDQAYQLDQSVTSNLISKHGLYDGFGEKAQLKIIDNPSIAENWYQLQIIQNSLIGLALGLFLGFAFVVVFPRQQIFKIFKSEISPLGSQDETLGLDGTQDFTPYNSQWLDYDIRGDGGHQDGK